MTRERWKPVAVLTGTERHQYEVSNLGGVRYFRISAGARAKRRTPYKKIGNHGYQTLRLGPEGKSKYFLVHRLIALAFIPNPKRLPQVDHINRDRTDNRIANLRWVDHTQQALNKPVQVGNALGVTGVRISKTGKGYCAEIALHHSAYYLGHYRTFAEACAARRAAEVVLHKWLSTLPA